MKPLIKNLFIALVGMILFTSPAVNVVAHATGFSGVVSFSLLFLAAIVIYLVAPSKKRNGVYVAGIQVEIWANYIIERLYKDNKFLQYAFSDDQYVLAGHVVHIPQPGAAPAITKNRTVFPAAAVRRTDTDITYVLDEYTSAPTHIENAEMVELSYDKMNSVYGDHAGFLVEYVADDIILKWLSESVSNVYKMYTSGGATAASVPVGTGNRKLLIHDDLRKANLKMNIDNIPKNDRYALLESNMLDQLLQSLSNTQYRDFSQYMDAKTGTIGKLYGFNILDRSQVAIAAADNSIKALGAAGATDDNAVSLLWQKDAIARALGSVKIFDDANRPEYYGDIISALMRMGGRRRRGDDKGVIALIQAPSA